jgi:hypothetical protein
MTIRKLIQLLHEFDEDSDAIVAFCDGNCCQVAEVVEVRDNGGRAQICAEDWDKRITAQGHPLSS